MHKSYVEFEFFEAKPKTSVYAVVSKSSGEILGKILWYSHWRQYVFKPETHVDTWWSRGCLQDVIAFIQKLMDERKETRVQKLLQRSPTVKLKPSLRE